MKNTLGAVMAYYREKYGLRQSVVYEGICSAATYFRVEMEERAVSFVIAEALLSRIGKDAEKIEFMVRSEEYDLWRKRLELRSAAVRQDFFQVQELTQEYRNNMPTNSGLHRQFCLYYEMKLAEWNKESAEEICRIAWSALSITKKRGDEPHKWRNLYNNMEMELLLTLVHYKFGKWGDYSNARSCLFGMLESIETYNSSALRAVVEERAWLELLILMAKHERNEVLLEYIEKAIACASRSDEIGKLAELHFHKALLLWHTRDNKNNGEIYASLCREECKMAFCIFRILGRVQEQKKVERFCWEELKWHITM